MEKQIAVISDIHSNSWALEAVISDAKQNSIDTIINLGDSIFGPLDPIGTIDILIDNNVINVMGNEDEIILNKKNQYIAHPILKYLDKFVTPFVIQWLQELPFQYANQTAVNNRILTILEI
jgi:predicted phosphodiesterase